MNVGIYSDVHLTKNMRSLQSIWDTTATRSLHYMYNKFDELGVEMVVCLGDFFDTPNLSAKNMSLVLPILDDINSRIYPTYILLGNHEIDDQEQNILEYLKVYENIHPVTSITMMENMLFIPYQDDPTGFDMKNTIVFTHHDIYGSALAAGKTKAFFGLDPLIFREAKLVMNGHVHTSSWVSNNILNVGSLLKSQQGEMRVGEYPQYYTLDTNTKQLNTYQNKHSMIYLTIDETNIGEVLQEGYDQDHLVLKVEYSGEIPKEFIDTAHTSWKKKISSIDDNKGSVAHISNFDLKNYLVEYLKKDTSLSGKDVEDYITTGLRLLQ